jgi:uncharacterized protein YutE (UPF0331/DUF86 family)
VSLNADLVRARCTEIEESLARLERFKTLSLEMFLADRDAQDLVCYRLLVAIEAALALCYHVSARRLRRVPEDYADCFAMLGDAGIIPQPLADRLRRMARFRNLLVHMYWKLEYRRVFEVLQNDLDDLREFSAAILKLT